MHSHSASTAPKQLKYFSEFSDGEERVDKKKEKKMESAFRGKNSIKEKKERKTEKQERERSINTQEQLADLSSPIWSSFSSKIGIWTLSWIQF